MAYYPRLMPSLLIALFVIQAMKSSHSKAFTDVSCIGAEREALLKIKQDLIDPSGRLQSWIGEGCCKWKGVECNKKTGHVLNLDLHNPCDGLECSLGGKIHHGLNELKDLRYLDLSFNNFSTQRIPNFLVSLQKLEYLNLSSVGFYGHVSNQLVNLSSLRYLDVSNSWWWPSIKIENLKDLRYLDLSFNNFSTQRIPNFLVSLQKLEYLNLSSVGFYGHVSYQLFNLSSLRYLDVSNSWWWSSIKIENLPWLSSFSNLKYLDLSYVPLPNSKEWLSPINTLSSLEFLILRGCNLKDVSSSLHVNFTSLKFLDLSHNSIYSSIPPWFRNMSKLEHLDLSFNNLRGIFPTFILENSGPLGFLDVSRNRLEGELLKNVSNFGNLEVLKLWSNKFSGRISGTKDGDLICGQSYMKTIDVSGNNFSGHIPNQFGNFKDLEFFDLSWNSISGPIPTTVVQLSSLRKLCHLVNLQYLNLAHNNLSGGIPRCFNNFSQMWANSNFTPYGRFLLGFAIMVNIKGTSVEFTTMLHYLFSIDLLSNALDGRIPKGLTRLARFQNLNLSQNKLIGETPSNIGNLRDLESLDLSNNKLSGEIPPSISNLDTLSCLDLSFNNLFGPIPSSNHLSTLNDQSVYRGNDGLCGTPLLKVCPGYELNDMDIRNSHNRTEDESKEGDSIFIGIYSRLGVSFPVVFLGFFGILHICSYYRQRRRLSKLKRAFQFAQGAQVIFAPIYSLFQQHSSINCLVHKVSSKRIATRSLLQSLLLLLLVLRVPRAVSENGTASYYSPPYQRTECYGEGSSQFPVSNLFAAVGDGLWDMGAACGREYELRCISDAQSGPGTCKPGAGNIRVKVVDYALSVESSAVAPRQSVTGADLVLSQRAFEEIANPSVVSIRVEFKRL